VANRQDAGSPSSLGLGPSPRGATKTAPSRPSCSSAVDDYYYSRQGQLPLPVLRVKFDDPAASWVYADPERGELLSIIHKYSRIERWLYNGLHSLDFAFWYHQRPLWDLAMILLLCGGLATSALGLYLGLRRLARDVRQLAQYLSKPRSTPGPHKETAKHATP